MKNFFRHKIVGWVLFGAIFALAAGLRLYGISWDQNHHLHPDERFLTMVAGAVSWPTSLAEYLDSQKSPLNPYNNDYGFFVYGTLPLKIVKAASEFITIDNFDYNNITLVGRLISALFDLGTLFLVFKIGRLVFNRKTALWAMFFYAVSVLPIQLSHFFAVDTFLVFFLTACFYLVQELRSNLRKHCSCGIVPAPSAKQFSGCCLRGAVGSRPPAPSCGASRAGSYKKFNSKGVTPVVARILHFRRTPLKKETQLSRQTLKPSQIDPQSPAPDGTGQTWYQLGRFVSSHLGISLLLGMCFGLALACKITAVLFLPVIGLGYLFAFLKTRNWRLTVGGLLFVLASYVSLRLADPRIFAQASFFDFSANPQFIANLEELKSFSDPETTFPPAVQWLSTMPVVFPLKNLLLWGLGLPLGLLAVGGVTLVLWEFFKELRVKLGNCHSERSGVKRRISRDSSSPRIFEGTQNDENQWSIRVLILIWVVFLFVFQSFQFVKAMRYFYPIYPFLAILAGYAFNWVFLRKPRRTALLLRYFLISLFLVSILIWPLSFISIYSREHSRVAASRWIYENIPHGSTISCEHWDDCLPLGIEGHSSRDYEIITLAVCGRDTEKKWRKLNEQLAKVDYLILSSNRAWGPMTRLTERYPRMVRFYEDLFAGRGDFYPVAEITSYPKLEIGDWKLEIPDEPAEEAFTVYDHPKVMIFARRSGSPSF